jgi:hypothetical protein
MEKIKMANYGYVLLENAITFEQLKNLTKLFNKTLDQPLNIHINNDQSICLNTLADDRDCLLLWIDTYEQQPCIIFEHKHIYEIYWWLSANIINYFAWYLHGKIADDGFAGIELPILNKYPLLNDWINIYKDQILRQIKKILIKAELEVLPEFKSYFKK